MINIILSGGLSQVESFDPKPQLDKHHGKPLKGPFDMDVVRSSIALFLIVFFGFATKAAAENDGDGEVLQWKLSEEVAGEALRQNPVLGHSLFPEEWHFLRTTRSDGPIETRKWLRDGRYERLGVHASSRLGWPTEFWISRDDIAPAVGRMLTTHTPGLTFEPGQVVIAPGPDHAVVNRFPAASQGPTGGNGNSRCEVTVIPVALSRSSRGGLPRRTEEPMDKLIIFIVQTGQ